MLGLTFGNVKEESVTSLVELQLFLFFIYRVIMETEFFIFEILEDFHLGAQVDWSLLLAEFTRLRPINGFSNLLLDFWFEIKIDSRPL